MRDYGGQLSFHPQPAPGWNGFSFGVHWRGARIRVTVAGAEVTYELDDGVDCRVELVHCGEPFTLSTGKPVVMPLEPVKPLTPRPTQPKGREPLNAADLRAPID
jgi:alpha,alpha-trehalose phosphorylase